MAARCDGVGTSLEPLDFCLERPGVHRQLPTSLRSRSIVPLDNLGSDNLGSDDLASDKLPGAWAAIASRGGTLLVLLFHGPVLDPIERGLGKLQPSLRRARARRVEGMDDKVLRLLELS